MDAATVNKLKPCRRRATAEDQAARIRFPRPMLDVLKVRANESGRSVNTEVIYLVLDALGVPAD